MPHSEKERLRDHKALLDYHAPLIGESNKVVVPRFDFVAHQHGDRSMMTSFSFMLQHHRTLEETGAPITFAHFRLQQPPLSQ